MYDAENETDWVSAVTGMLLLVAVLLLTCEDTLDRGADMLHRLGWW